MRPCQEKVTFERIAGNVGRRRLELAAWRRPGTGEGTLLYLHGLGSSKSDFLPAAHDLRLAGRTLVAFDYPGSFRSPYPDELVLGAAELAELAWQVAERLAEGPITVIGHSLGGAVGLLVAERHAGAVERFVSVEGNLQGSDCFLVRPLASMEDEEFSRGGFLARLEERYCESALLGDRVWADAFRATVSERAFLDYGRSLVELSDEGDLLRRFLELPIERVFVHGEAHRDLPYLARLRAAGVTVCEVPGGGHWPLYENPGAFLSAVARLLHPETATARTFDARELAAGIAREWLNLPLAAVDQHVLRLSVLAGDFHWHHHESDEALYVVEGELAVDLEGRSERLVAGEGIRLPAGVRHRTRGAPRAVSLAFESAALDVRGAPGEPGERRS